MMAGRIMAAAPVVGDLGVGMINKMFGTNYAGPTEAFQHLFTKLGVPEPQSAAEHVVWRPPEQEQKHLLRLGLRR